MELCVLQIVPEHSDASASYACTQRTACACVYTGTAKAVLGHPAGRLGRTYDVGHMQTDTASLMTAGVFAPASPHGQAAVG